MDRDPEYLRAKRALLRKLNRRELHTLQALRWLEEQEFSEEVRAELVQEFQQKGFLDDTAYLERMISSQKRRGRGPRQIGQTLYQRGIPFSEEELRNRYSIDERKEGIRSFLNKKYGDKGVEDPKRRARAIAALQRRGFQWEDIEPVLIEFSQSIHLE